MNALFSRMQRVKSNACKELKVPLHLAAASGSNIPPLWGETCQGTGGSFRETRSCPIALQRSVCLM